MYIKYFTSSLGLWNLLCVSVVFINVFRSTADELPSVNMETIANYKREFDTYDLHPRKVIIPLFGSTPEQINSENDDWWEVQYTPAYIFDPIRMYRLFLRRVEIDVNLLHSCYEYKVVYKNDISMVYQSSSFCYPSIVITGVPKCSTSAMFGLLASSPLIISNPVKENCLFPYDAGILEYFASLPKSIPPHQYHIDGCIDVVGNMMLRKILRNPNTFYIVMVRNFVDMTWSAYNYWCDPSIDRRCDEDNLWADPRLHHRSPEHFHQIVMANVNVSKGLPGSVVGPHRVKNPCDLARNIYSHYISFLHEHTPPESTMVVASEELERDPASVWKRLVEKSGIPGTPEPDFSSFTKVRYNTQVQGERGADVTVDLKTYTPGKYTISGNKPLLDESRRILDQCWHNDCKIVSRFTSFQYDACRDEPTVKPETKSKNPSTLQLPDMKSLSLSDKAKESMNKLFALYQNMQFSGYLKRKLQTCAMEYGNTQLEMSSLLAFTQQLATLESKNANSFRRLAEVNSGQVLVVLQNDNERDFFRGLLRYSFGSDQIFDAVSDRRRSWTKTTCESARAVTANITQIEMIQSTLDNDQSKKVLFRFKNSLDNPCPNRFFSKLIVARNDILEEAWAYFLRQYVQKDIYGMPEFRGTSGEWSKWDSEALGIVTHPNFSHVLPFNVDGHMLDSLTKENMLTIVTSQLILGSKKVDILRNIVKFVSDDPSSSGLNYSHVKCTFLLAQSLYLDIVGFHGNRQFVERAFKSVGLLCLIKQHYSKYSNLDLISYPRPFTCPPQYDNSSRIQSISTDAAMTALALDQDSSLIDVWKCNAKYSRRGYIDGKMSHHVVPIIGEYTAETINIRFLFEYATGLLTGSTISKNDWLPLFQGEFACGQRLGLIHMKWTGRTVMHLTKTNMGAIRLPLASRRKCMKGMVRGFSKAILIVRDPFLDIWHSYLTMRNLPLYNATALIGRIDMTDWRETAVAIANNFTRTNLKVGSIYDTMTEMFNETFILAVSHEALIYAEDEGENRVNDRYANLMKLIAFSGHQDSTSRVKLRCAYSFLNIINDLKDGDAMVSHYVRSPGLICDIKRIISMNLNSHIEIHHTFGSYPCKHEHWR